MTQQQASQRNIEPPKSTKYREKSQAIAALQHMQLHDVQQGKPENKLRVEYTHNYLYGQFMGVVLLSCLVRPLGFRKLLTIQLSLPIRLLSERFGLTEYLEVTEDKRQKNERQRIDERYEREAGGGSL